MPRRKKPTATTIAALQDQYDAARCSKTADRAEVKKLGADLAAARAEWRAAEVEAGRRKPGLTIGGE